MKKKNQGLLIITLWTFLFFLVGATISEGATTPLNALIVIEVFTTVGFLSAIAIIGGIESIRCETKEHFKQRYNIDVDNEEEQEE
jgi:hypothetical protein